MHAKILGFHNEENLTVVQLATPDQDMLKYISSNTAIKQNLIEVKEVSAGGSVNSLLVINNSGFLVFMMDGDILAGAKQNRVLNTSILLAPQSTTTIPVSCVEQGRWRSVSDKFSPTDYTAPSFVRASKSRDVSENLDAMRGHMANQSQVWDGVTLFQLASEVNSKSSNLSDVFDNKAGKIEDFIKRFAHVQGANGVAMFIDGNLLSTDLFNRTDIYQEYFPRLLRGVALEAFYLSRPKHIVTEAEAAFKTLEFLDRCDTLEHTEHPGVGLGNEQRFNADDLTGFELRYENQSVHFSALRTQASRKPAA